MAEKTSNNALYFIVGALVVLVAIGGYYIYNQEADKPGVSIEISEDGVKIDD